MSILIGDIETNGLNPNTIWVVGVLDYETDEFTGYTHDRVAEGLQRLVDADVVIGHNFRSYDAYHIERLLDGLLKFDQAKIVDTLELCRKVVPELKTPGLETWGEIFGYPKIHFKAFEKYDPAMVPYCERDCRINKLVFDFLMEAQKA